MSLYAWSVLRRKTSVIVLVLLSYWTIQKVLADHRVVCPADPSVFGYTSTADMNHDIMDEVKRLVRDPHATPKPKYLYKLCPDTTFDGKERLVPLLNNSVFECGANGDSNNRCNISGGETQVLIVESPSHLKMEYLSFRGITFSRSTRFSVASLATNETTAEFHDCNWKDGTGGSAIHIVHQSSPTDATDDRPVGEVVEKSHNDEKPSMNVHVYDSSVTGGNVKDGGQNRAFYSQGYLRLHNVLVENNVGTLCTNIVGGSALIEKSRFVGNTFQASLLFLGQWSDANSHWHFFDLQSVVRAISESSVTIRDTDFVNNSVFGTVAAIASNVTVERCMFQENVATIGGDVLIFDKSHLQMKNSCIMGGEAYAPVSADSGSSFYAEGNYGEGTYGNGFCPYETGILVEEEGYQCIRGEDVECSGECTRFDADSCSLIANESETASS